MNHKTEACERIVSACRWLESERLVYGTWGNISVRWKDGLLITPSRISYDELVPEDMIEMCTDGEILSGGRIPSSERDIHRLVMKNRLDIGAVVHTHSPYACAASAAGMDIPALIEEVCQLVGGSIPCNPLYIPGGQHLELAEHTVSTLCGGNSEKRKMAVLIRNHGPVCCGATLSEALTCCQVVEKAAHMFLCLSGSLVFTPIPEELAREERGRYLYKYGKE